MLFTPVRHTNTSPVYRREISQIIRFLKPQLDNYYLRLLWAFCWRHRFLEFFPEKEDWVTSCLIDQCFQGYVQNELDNHFLLSWCVFFYACRRRRVTPQKQTSETKWTLFFTPQWLGTPWANSWTLLTKLLR